MKKFATVVIDAVIGNDDKTFSYEIPPGMHVEIGSRVFVNFSNRDVEGFVLGITDSVNFDASKIKPITKSPDDFAVIKPETLEILDCICHMFKLRKIDVLRLFIPKTIRARKRKRKREVRESSVACRQLADIGKITLTKEQQEVISSIKDPGTHVIHGVTGSGKTEVYMNLISKTLEDDKSAIMLVPEIGLTPQVLANFTQRFGDNVAILHSKLTEAQRYDEWLRLFSGAAKIAVGARSAVFAPLDNVGIIIIDEEHDTSYFSESNPRYHTHEIAKLRATHHKCPLVLGSATPSIDTFHKAKSGEYKLLTLKSRVNDLQMPTIQLVNMIDELRRGNGGIFSNEMVGKLTEEMQKESQAIIFLNRRGFSASISCRSCGWVAKCENCDVSLVYHKEESQVKCHYCAARFTSPNVCQPCGSHYLKYGSTGTQKVVEELQKLFPESKIFRMDADAAKGKDAVVEILDEFAATKSSILVGTQMIAKGHHFPLVSFVGVIEADNSLHFSDFRAVERTFALITQVAGRAGRNKEQGHVIIQTLVPRHYVYQLAQGYDYDQFFEKELNIRQITKYPPFTSIIRVLATGVVDKPIKDALQGIMQKLRSRQDEFIYLGAMKSPLGRVQNKFRYQILCRFKTDKEDLVDFIATAVKEHSDKRVQLFLEINPQNLS